MRRSQNDGSQSSSSQHNSHPYQTPSQRTERANVQAIFTRKVEDALLSWNIPREDFIGDLETFWRDIYTRHSRFTHAGRAMKLPSRPNISKWGTYAAFALSHMDNYIERSSEEWTRMYRERNVQRNRATQQAASINQQSTILNRNVSALLHTQQTYRNIHNNNVIANTYNTNERTPTRLLGLAAISSQLDSGLGWVWERERRTIPPNPTRQCYTVFNSVNCADGVSRQC